MEPIDHEPTFDPRRVAELLSSPRRLRALERLQLLDTSADDRFDRLTRLAARLLCAHVCMISLVDSTRQFVKSAAGLQQGTSMPLEGSFCQHPVASRRPLRVSDALDQPEMRTSIWVTKYGARSYLGVPLVTSGGEVVGTLCAIGFAPREWTDQDLLVLQDLAASAVSEAELLACARDLEFVNDTTTHRSGVMERLLDELADLRNRERRRIAGEVHDQSLQDVVAALMSVRTLQEHSRPELAERELHLIERCLESAAGSLREMIDSLSPLQLPHAELQGFLREAIDELGRLFGVDVHAQLDLHAARTDAGTHRLVHRCVVELVGNACRHSSSSDVHVSASVQDDEVWVAVTDGGAGWQATPPPGGGLSLLAQDLHAVGGRLSSWHAATGFTVEARIAAAGGAGADRDELLLGAG